MILLNTDKISTPPNPAMTVPTPLGIDKPSSSEYDGGAECWDEWRYFPFGKEKSVEKTDESSHEQAENDKRNIETVVCPARSQSENRFYRNLGHPLLHFIQ